MARQRFTMGVSSSMGRWERRAPSEGRRWLWGVAWVLLLGGAGCKATVWQARFVRPRAAMTSGEAAAAGADQATGARRPHGRPLDREAPYVKCHLRDGSVAVLRSWRLDPARREVAGVGIFYDPDRTVVRRGRLRVPVSQILLLETTRPQEISRITWASVAVFAVLSAGTVVGAALCAANPKACWGSCPTFYAWDGRRLMLQAEGFSWSVARVLEDTDVDALFTARPRGHRLTLVMTNEALETHAVRRVQVLAVPRSAGARVYRSGERFYPARATVAPRRCRSEQGDCVARLRARDHQEYLSPADGRDLAAREQIALTFPRPAGRHLGLVVTARNSLLNTFLFYQLLAYMGRRAAEWWMKLELGGRGYADVVRRTTRLLGDIEVAVWTGGAWRHVGAFSEVGPLAKEVQLIRLPESLPPGPVRARLTLTRGNWKLDQVALASLGEPVSARVLDPVRATDRRGRPAPDALARLRDPKRYLFTGPRSVYRLEFQLPAQGRYELFLRSRGYYYEWIRKEWMHEESPARLLEFLLFPARALRRLAPAYKRLEHRMDSVFWKSRVGAWP